MKTTIMAAVLALIVSAAFAKGPGGVKGGGYYRPRTTIVVGGGYYSPFYSPFGFGYGYPYYQYGRVASQPTKLDMQVNDIKNDYADKIASVRLDRSLTGKERREQIRAFKRERDSEVLEAKRNYYKQ